MRETIWCQAREASSSSSSSSSSPQAGAAPEGCGAWSACRGQHIVSDVSLQGQATKMMSVRGSSYVHNACTEAVLLTLLLPAAPGPV